jgi:hypothetical protein
MRCMKRSRRLITLLVVVNLLGVLLAPLPANLFPSCVWGPSATFLLGFLAIGQLFPSADGPMRILIRIVINFPVSLVCESSRALLHHRSRGDAADSGRKRSAQTDAQAWGRSGAAVAGCWSDSRLHVPNHHRCGLLCSPAGHRRCLAHRIRWSRREPDTWGSSVEPGSSVSGRMPVERVCSWLRLGLTPEVDVAAIGPLTAAATITKDHE